MTHFRGKVVMITGATGVLGTALCQHYARAGARIAALDLDPLRLDELAETLHVAGSEIRPIAGNVTDATAVGNAVATTVGAFGGIDLIICNAGIMHHGLLKDTSAATIHKVMEVNFFGAVNLTLAALPHIAARQGSIAAISSIAGFSPLLGHAGYAASKHALHGFFDSLRGEVSESGVSVTLICPSFISSESNVATGAGLENGSTPALARGSTGGGATPEQIAERIFAAITRRQDFLLPDATSRVAWWFSRVLPAAYARTMRRRLAGEFKL